MARRTALGQRPSMSRIRGYVGIWLSSKELRTLADALAGDALRGGALTLRGRLLIAADWADQEAKGR